MRHPWYATERVPSFTGIPLHVIILSITEGIWFGQEYLIDDVVSKIIEKFNGKQIPGRFDNNQIRGICRVFDVR